MTDLTKLSVAELRDKMYYRVGAGVGALVISEPALDAFDELADRYRRLEEAQGAIAKEVSEKDKELLAAIEPFVDGSCYLAEPSGKESIGATALIRGLAKKLKRRIEGEGR